jgi:hypothetical protein
MEDNDVENGDNDAENAMACLFWPACRKLKGASAYSEHATLVAAMQRKRDASREAEGGPGSRDTRRAVPFHSRRFIPVVLGKVLVCPR